MQPENLFAPPRAELIDQDTGKRPAWVWVIFLYFMFSLLSVILTFSAMYSGWGPMAEFQTTLRAQFSPLSMLITVVVVTVNTTGAIALFRLRRLAAPAFALSVVLNVSSYVIRQLMSASPFSIKTLLVALPSLAILLLIALYAYRLRKTGVLR